MKNGEDEGSLYTFYYISQTRLALLVEDEDGEQFWFAKSRCPIIEDNGREIVLFVPDWIARNEGIL